MIANIYICDKSFAYNGSDTLRDLQKRILGMRNLLYVIKEKQHENKLYLQHENFIKTVIYGDGDTVESVIFGTEDKQREMKDKYTRDVYNIMLSIFNCPHSPFSHEDMMEMLSEEYEDENNCNGVVAMNELSEFPKTKQILYDEKGFYQFRRYYIGKLVKEPIVFMEQIESYYDNLILNSDLIFFKDKLSEVLESHGSCIIKCLTALSENFKKEYRGQGCIKADNPSMFLELFAKSNGLDDGSFEGKNEKCQLNCEFRKDKSLKCKEKVMLYCGPHLKMYHDDKGRDNQHMRVYFAWDKDNLDVVYVGMISSHVNN